MKEGLIKDTTEVVIKEIQTVITISYILAVGIGMLFNFQKFSEFGINIFDYADVFDFLIAPFSDFKILLFTIISLTLTYFIFRGDLLWKRKFPKSYSKHSFGWDKKNGIILIDISLLQFYLFSTCIFQLTNMGRFQKNRF